MSRLVTVFGATGAQGGAVVEALLAGGEFKVRGVTRSLGSKKAKDLTLQGVEMVQGSFDEPESLDTAIAGSYGVFLVTNYWEGMDGARETKQGKCAVDACLKAGVKHLIYSGLVRSEKKYGFVVGKQQARIADQPRVTSFFARESSAKLFITRDALILTIMTTVKGVSVYVNSKEYCLN